MTSEELLEIVSCGEPSTVQFKARMPHPDSIAAELIAFSNSKGGTILLGSTIKPED